MFRVLERATDLLAVAPLERAIPAAHRRSMPLIGERTVPRRLVAIPIDPGPNHAMRAPWGEPDEPLPFVTIVTRRWPAGRPVPGRLADRATVIEAPAIESNSKPQPRSTGRRQATRPARRRLVARLAMLALALIASLVAAELAGRGRPTIGSSRA